MLFYVMEDIMRFKHFLCIGLSALMLFSCAGGDSAGKDDKTTAAETTTTVPHTHLEAEKFPDTIDFANEEEVIRMFDMCSVLDGVSIKVLEAQKTVNLKATVNGTAFSLNINLSGAAGKTKPSQIVTCARLFWYCYPQMYARFGAVGNSPTTVTLDIENMGYGIASAGGNRVHIHDQWLLESLHMNHYILYMYILLYHLYHMFSLVL